MLVLNFINNVSHCLYSSSFPLSLYLYDFKMLLLAVKVHSFSLHHGILAWGYVIIFSTSGYLGCSLLPFLPLSAYFYHLSLTGLLP